MEGINTNEFRDFPLPITSSYAELLASMTTKCASFDFDSGFVCRNVQQARDCQDTTLIIQGSLAYFKP